MPSHDKTKRNHWSGATGAQAPRGWEYGGRLSNMDTSRQPGGPSITERVPVQASTFSRNKNCGGRHRSGDGIRLCGSPMAESGLSGPTKWPTKVALVRAAKRKNMLKAAHLGKYIEPVPRLWLPWPRETCAHLGCQGHAILGIGSAEQFLSDDPRAGLSQSVSNYRHRHRHGRAKAGSLVLSTNKKYCAT